MNIIIADDNKLFKEAVIMFLESELKHRVIAEYNNGADLFSDNKMAEADIILLDIEMPELNGIQVMYEINKTYEWMKVIAITNYYEKAYLTELINSGFSGCVFKNSIYNELSNAISIVHNGGKCFPSNILLS